MILLRKYHATQFALVSLLALPLLLSSCAAKRPRMSHPQPSATRMTQLPVVLRATPKPLPPLPILETKLHSFEADGVHFKVVCFDTRKHHLDIVDQAKGPGSQYTSSRQLGQKTSALAVINAGFFTPAGKPLGILITKGKQRGSWNPSSLGKGIYYRNGDQAHLTRASAWHKTLKNNPPSELLQTGPTLLINGKKTKGLSSEKQRARSFIISDGKHYFAIGHAESTSLDKLANLLSAKLPLPFQASDALNLDGGRSSDLWVSDKVTGGSTEIRGFFNKNVRNFLILR